MRNSNKLLALALAAALALGTTATAFAAEDGKDSKGETTPTNTTAPADTDKKDETTPAGGEEKKEDPSGKFEFRPVGYGLQDVPSIVAAADEAGSEWFVVEQDGPSMNRTSMECAEMSIRYLKSFL